MRSRVMHVLALCVLMLPLLYACAATQDASVPSLTSRAAAAISAAETAHAARASALKATTQPSADSFSAAMAASGTHTPWRKLIDRARSLNSSGVRNQETATQPFWDSVLNRIKSMNSGGAAGQDAFSLPSIWRSVYENYREAQTSRNPGGQGRAIPQ